MKIILNFLRISVLILIFLLALNEATKIYIDDILESQMLEVSSISSIPLNGYFEEVEENNYLITGAYKNGILDGDISISDSKNNLIFTGYVQNGIYAGFGQTYYYGNVIYEGRLKNGLYNGYGTEYNYDKEGNLNWIYKGQFKNGHKNGYGIIEVDNVIYSGTFHNDVFEGKYYATDLPIVPNIPSLMMEPNFNEKYEKTQENDNKLIDKIIKYVSKETKNEENNIYNEEKNIKGKQNDIKSINNVQNDTKIKRYEFLNIIKESEYESINNIYEGNDNGNLMLDDNITYQEVLQILYRILEKNDKIINMNISDEDFKSFNNINASEWAKKTIAYLNSIGLINYDDNFDYKKEITKTELYTILNNLDNFQNPY